MSATRARLALLAGSTVLSLGALAVVLHLTGHDVLPGFTPSVLLVDNANGLAQLLVERREQGPEIPFELVDPMAVATLEEPALVREPVPEDHARVLFPALNQGAMVYDPHSFFMRTPSHGRWRDWPELDEGRYFVRINARGHRGREVTTPRPDLRLLVTGDSHTEGVAPMDKNFSALMEVMLNAWGKGRTSEVLNAGLGGANLYNYLGILERDADLLPDVFVVVVYGGNDFASMMSLQRYFHRRENAHRAPDLRQRLLEDQVETRGALPQELTQVIYFRNNPDDVELATQVTCAISAEIARLARGIDCSVVFAYLPPPSSGQPAHHREPMRRLLARYRVDPDLLDVSDRIADGWLAYLEAAGLPAVDLRPALRTEEDAAYWEADHHINLVGHAAVARALLPVVTGVIAERLRDGS